MISYHMAAGWRTLTIRETTFERLSKYHESKNIEKKLSPWIDDFLIMNLDKGNFLTQKYAPHLKNMGIHDNFVLLNDEKNKGFVKVILKDGKLHCDVDKSDHCVHIQYVMALPELSEFFRNKK